MLKLNWWMEFPGFFYALPKMGKWLIYSSAFYSEL
jgi:hypothetical protein